MSTFSYDSKQMENEKVQKGVFTSRSVAVRGDFRNGLGRKLSLCRNCSTKQLFLLKRGMMMVMQGWRLRISSFLKSWPTETDFATCNGLQRKNFTRVCEVFCFYSHSSKTQLHTSSHHMCCSHHLWTSVAGAHLLPRPNVLMWCDCLLLCMKFFHLSA